MKLLQMGFVSSMYTAIFILRVSLFGILCEIDLGTHFLIKSASSCSIIPKRILSSVPFRDCYI